MTILLGLNGRKGSGKDTAFQFVSEWCAGRGVRAERRGFADKLKISAARALGFESNDDQGLIDSMDQMKIVGSVESKIEWGEHDIQEAWLSGRGFLQRYGTEAHRDVFGENFWVDALLPLSTRRQTGPEWYKNWPEETDLAVITDVRFENEAKRIYDLGGEVWEVHRPLPGQVDTHASENPMPVEFISNVVYNTRDLNGLREEIHYALLKLFKENP